MILRICVHELKLSCWKFYAAHIFSLPCLICRTTQSLPVMKFNALQRNCFLLRALLRPFSMSFVPTGIATACECSVQAISVNYSHKEKKRNLFFMSYSKCSPAIVLVFFQTGAGTRFCSCATAPTLTRGTYTLENKRLLTSRRTSLGSRLIDTLGSHSRVWQANYLSVARTDKMNSCWLLQGVFWRVGKPVSRLRALSVGDLKGLALEPGLL